MPVPYLIIGFPRSGTTVIHLAIKGHPNVAALNDELELAPLFTQGISTFTHGNDLPHEKAAGVRVIYEAITRIDADANTQAYGAKCTCNTPRRARMLVEILRKVYPELKIILTVRHDIAALYGSLMSAKKSGRWHSWYKQQSAEKPRVRINRWVFTRYALNCLESYEILRSLRETHEVYESSYEAFATNPNGTYAALFEFLGVPALEVSWMDSKKVMPAPAEYITNYEATTRLVEQLRSAVAVGRVPKTQRRIAAGVTALYRLTNLKGLVRTWRRRRQMVRRKAMEHTSTVLMEKLTSL